MNVLYVQHGPGIGGAKISLYHMLKCAPPAQKNYLALASPIQTDYETLVVPYVEKIYYQEIPTWQKYYRHTLPEKLKAPFVNAYRIVQVIPAAIKLSKIIKAENIKLVHTNNSITLVGALAARLARVPHVWHIREPFGSKKQYKPILGDTISFWLTKKLSKAIICNSKFTAQPFSERGISHCVLQNGLDLAGFKNTGLDQRKLRTEYAIKPDEILIGMVGNLTTKWKRHDLFLDVVAILKKEFTNLRFIVFGASSDLTQTEYTLELKRQASSLGIDHKVIWAEFIDNPSLIMNCLDILIHPALNEGSGRVVMEAMVAGKAVVAMRSGGVQELIENGKTGFLIEPGEVEALVAKVKALLEDESLRENMGNNAQKFAQAHFSDQASMNAIVEIYRDVVA